MKVRGQITIHNVRDGETAEFYRLKVVREEAIVKADGVLKGTFSYSIEYVKGSLTTIKNGNKTELYVTCRTNTNVNVPITLGAINSGTFTLNEYIKAANRPDYFIVELKKGNEVVETRSVQVMMEAASYTKIVNDMRETISTNGKDITSIRQDAQSIRIIAEGLRTGVRNLLTGGKIEKTYHTSGFNKGKTNLKLKPNTTYTMTVSGHISTEAVSKGQTLRTFIIASDFSWYSDSGIEINTTNDVVKHYTFTTPETLPNDGACVFDACPLPSKLPPETNGDITVNWAVVTEGTIPAAEWIPSKEESAEERVKSVELKLENGEFRIKSDKTVFVDDSGKESVLIQNGKLAANLIDAKEVRTTPSDSGLHIEMYEGTFDILTKGNKKGISMTVDKDGFPHLIFFDTEGNAKYDLGYTGLKELVSSYRAAYWTKHNLVSVTDKGLSSIYPKTAKGKVWHEYHAAFHYATGNLGEHADDNGKYFDYEGFGKLIPDGWYTVENMEGNFVADDSVLELGENPKRIYSVFIQKFEGGLITKRGNVRFIVRDRAVNFCDADGKLVPVQNGYLQNYPFDNSL